MVKAKAPRNKTLELSPKEIALYASKAVKLSQKSNLTDVINRVIRQDSFKALDLLPDDCIDLMIVDPPYNLTKNFGKSTFKEMDFDAYKNGSTNGLRRRCACLKTMRQYIFAPIGKLQSAFRKLPENILSCETASRGKGKKDGEPKTTGKTVWKTSGFYQGKGLYL